MYGTSESGTGITIQTINYEFRLDKNALYRSTDGGKTYNLVKTYAANTFTSAYDLCLFSGSNGSSLNNGRLYYFRLYENNVLVRDFIPCRMLDTNTVCLYDKVTDTFFTNAGTGTFVAGPEVS